MLFVWNFLLIAIVLDGSTHNHIHLDGWIGILVFRGNKKEKKRD